MKNKREKNLLESTMFVAQVEEGFVLVHISCLTANHLLGYPVLLKLFEEREVQEWLMMYQGKRLASVHCYRTLDIFQATQCELCEPSTGQPINPPINTEIMESYLSFNNAI